MTTKEIPQYVLHGEETIVERPRMLNPECPIEVPVFQRAEARMQVPKPVVELAQKEVPV